MKVGDVVTLKGDDQVKMTVLGVDKTSARCVWFDSNREIKSKDISISILKKVED